MHRPPTPAHRKRSAVHRFGQFLLVVALLATGPFVGAQSAGAVGSSLADAYGSLSTASFPDWMSTVPGTTSLAQMSIPGTHETLAIHGGSMVQAQEDHGDSGQTLTAQLNAGIRAVDIRLRITGGNKFAIHHAAFYQNANFDDVLTQAQTFLKLHPGETLMMRLKAECEATVVGCTDDIATPIQNSCVDNWAIAPGSSGATQNGQLAILCDYIHRYPGLFYAPSVNIGIPSRTSLGGVGTVTTAKTAVPKLFEARGHVVVTNYNGPQGGDYGIGLDGYGDHLEDQYNASNATVKLATVEANLQAAAAAPNDMYVSYTSASTVPFGFNPAQYAGGIPDPDSDDAHPFVPGVNLPLLNYLNALPATGHLGTVMMDFPGWALIQDVIQRNPFPAQKADPAPTSASIENAYSFLLQDLDQTGSGDQLRVPRSYQGGYFAGPTFPQGGFQASFTYDNALVITALLQRPTSNNVSHAVALGESLLYAQAHDPLTADGRLRTSYEPSPFVTAAGTPYVGGFSVYTGNMAWAGMALTRLYHVTGQQAFLDGALQIANWIQKNTADTRGAGGYAGGLRNDDGTGQTMVPITWKATEHNIDVGAFFAMLAGATGDPGWQQHSYSAFGFVQSMQAGNGHLWTGTGLDGVTTNQDVEPEDVQTWSYLATLDNRYAPAVDWAAGRMAATDGPFTGVSFSGTDTSKVWFEGTAHLLAAYNARGAAGDSAKAAALLATLQQAQTGAPNTDGKGIVAASSDGLVTGEGDIYYAALHTGATAWYLIAAQGGNPFRL